MELTDTQVQIMKIAKDWLQSHSTPIEKRYIVEQMSKHGIGYKTVNWTLLSMIRKGYLRRGYSEKANTRCYVVTGNI